MGDRLALALAELVDALRAELAVEIRPDSPDRLLSVDEAAVLLGIGRSRLYDEIASGRCWSVKVGRRRLIPASAIGKYTQSSGPTRPGLLPIVGRVSGTTSRSGRRRSEIRP